MADTREIKIILETTSGASAGEETERADTKASNASSKASSSSGNKSAGSLAGAMLTLVAEQALSESIAWVDYYVNRELDLNDDYIGQRNLQIAEKAVNWGVSAASTIGSTALMGASFGPVGAIIGAVAGAGIVAARTARENVQAMDRQNIMLNKLQAQLSFTRQRSGWSLQAASIGEDL